MSNVGCFDELDNEEDIVWHDKEKRIHGCEHYQRNCELYFKCCDTFYPCFHCHDKYQQHVAKKEDVSYIKCMICGSEQGISNKCAGCGIKFGEYYCRECILYENDKIKNIYVYFNII